MSVKTYKYEEWDIKPAPYHLGFDERTYVDLEGNPITGILEGFYGYTSDTSDPKNSQYVENGKRL
jgi:hypothetical protein